MLTIGSLGVIAPWMLLGLLALPVIWWLLRVTPPSPRRVQFPAIRLLLGLKQTEESSSRTPWWLLALRLLTAALIIIALAEPILNPGSQLRGDGPLLVVIDDDWAAATNWEDRIVSVQDILDQAGRERRPVAILTTAPHADGSKPRISSLMPADEANQLMDGIVPKPWKADHRAALEALIDLPFQLPAEVVWLSNGIGETENTVTQDLAERMS
ncbi:MAG: BatA domain-containing protein, partial [Proteobacteria bacterium]|nr:BatA domain-containing protein [Pseudomonadota bacterium]